jgi:N6-adenosine-specific RNA methylase IME4
VNWPFGDLRPLSYDLIMVDPPWTFKNYSAKGERKGPSAQYRCMNLADIKALPVGQLASPDCLLWLWATNPMLNVAIEVMQAWGFTFKTAGHWVKTTKHGHLGFGTGYILRSAGVPHARRADLFSRQTRPNWDCWGHEKTKFDMCPLSTSGRGG